MNRFYRDSIVSSIVSLVLAWITQFPLPYRVVLLLPTCNGCQEPIQIHPLNFLIDFAFWLVISLSILSIIDYDFIRDNEQLNKKASLIEASLGVSFAVGVIVLLGTLYSLQFVFGNVDPLGFSIPVWITAAAITYLVISTRSLGCEIKGALLRLGRNFLVALLGGFIFTLATSSFYSNEPFYDFWAYMRFLMTGILVLWFSVAFVVVCAFNVYYSRRERVDKQSETLAKSI